MKTFITEQQLALYKYQPQSRYYDLPMCDIVSAEFQLTENKDIFFFVSSFYHRLIDFKNNIWEVVFPDKSIMLIRENEKGIYIKCIESIDYSSLDKYFS